MPHPWRRTLGCMAALPFALLLAGCEVSGTVDVRSATEVVADLTITKAEADCLGLKEYAGLVVSGTPDPDGDQLCHARGTVDLEELKEFGIEVRQLGEYVTVDLAMPQQIGYMPTRIDIRFPGAVLEPGRTTASGNQVRLEQGVGIREVSTTRMVALSHAGPEWWVVGVAGGFLGGVGVTVLSLLLARRHRRSLAAAHAEAATLDPITEVPDFPPPVGPPTVAVAPPPPAPPVTPPTDAAPPGHPTAGPDYEALFAKPPEPVAAHPPPAPAGAPATPAPGAPPEDHPDHRIWAPPEDRPAG